MGAGRSLARRLSRPGRVWLRRAIFQVHLWVGVTAALYMVLISVTGAALVFRIHLQRVAHPELLDATGEAPIADIATVIERVEAAYPALRLSGVQAPTTDRPTHLAYVLEGDLVRTVLIDPFTAEVRGELPEASWVRTLQYLHYDLLAGRTGRVVNAVGGVCLLVLALTGVVIWWPGRRAWWRSALVDWRRPWRRVLWELHGAVGIWTAALIAVWAVTAVYFAFPAEFRAAVARVSPVTTPRLPRSAPERAGGGGRQPWPTLIDRARAVEPGAFVASVVAPATPTAPVQVLFSDRQPTPVGVPRLRPVYLDQYSGEPLAVPPSGPPSLGDRVMTWVAPLHVGNFGGWPVRLVWFVTGLAPALLAVTALVLWWSRGVSAPESRSALPSRAGSARPGRWPRRGTRRAPDGRGPRR